jgi:tetratricopeptide (TPR) repeat protein
MQSVLPGATGAENSPLSHVLATAAAHLRRSEYGPALGVLDEALRLAPDHAEVHYLQGVACYQAKRFEEAAHHLRRAVEVNGTNARYRSFLGDALRAVSPADAIPELLKAIELAPGEPHAYSSLATVYAKQHQYDEALRICDEAMRACPKDLRILGSRAGALLGLDRLEEALASWREQATMLPPPMQPFNSMGLPLWILGRIREAKESFEKWLQFHPDDPTGHFSISELLLLLGEYKQGFREYEWRWKIEPMASKRRNFPQPEWDGHEQKSARLLLYHEQGVGDILQFLRFVPAAAQKVGEILMAVRPHLMRLMGWTSQPVLILPEGAPLPDFDLHRPLLSLPYLLGTDLDSIPAPITINVPVQEKRKWHLRLGGGAEMKVGIVWAGNPEHTNDRRRSMPLRCFLPLLNNPALHFFSLQVGQPSKQLDEPEVAGKVTDLAPELADYADTAAAISQLDLVITVDTSVAHLAGSLGCPVWVLVPDVPDWRWLLERDDSPWYPSARIFRQRTRGDWQGVIDQLSLALSSLLESRPQPDSRPEKELARWSDVASLEPLWNERAHHAADFIPAGSTVMDLGCGAMALEQFLPFGSGYVPYDVAPRDSRTILCDFNEHPIPRPPASVTHAACLGVLEYLRQPAGFLRQVRAFQVPLVLSYCPTDMTSRLSRTALGWVNHLSLEDLSRELADAGFHIQRCRAIDSLQVLIRAVPVETRQCQRKRVLVLSYSNAGNFGDRLGFHLISSILPAQAEVYHGTFQPWNVPDGEFDLLVLGIGNSMFQPLLTDELISLVRQTPRSIGIFGTQYRDSLDPARLKELLDSLTVWFARNEEDILLYGRGRQNAVHLGDWQISAFPLTRWTQDDAMRVGPEIWNDLPLDRTIQTIQKYRTVVSGSLHPLLCALTSAEKVAYSEQKDPLGRPSGKFRSLLMDVFGQTWPEDTLFEFDRDAVAGYRAKVLRNVAAMQGIIAELLGG